MDENFFSALDFGLAFTWAHIIGLRPNLTKGPFGLDSELVGCTPARVFGDAQPSCLIFIFFIFYFVHYVIVVKYIN